MGHPPEAQCQGFLAGCVEVVARTVVTYTSSAPTEYREPPSALRNNMTHAIRIEPPGSIQVLPIGNSRCRL